MSRLTGQWLATQALLSCNMDTLPMASLKQQCPASADPPPCLKLELTYYEVTLNATPCEQPVQLVTS